MIRGFVANEAEHVAVIPQKLWLDINQKPLLWIALEHISCEALPSFVIRILGVVSGRGRSGSHVTGRIQSAALHTIPSDNIICLRN
jgi:hypothetical protein